MFSFSFCFCTLQVTNWYSIEAFNQIFNKPEDFEKKQHAVAYINSNSETHSGRRVLMNQRSCSALASVLRLSSLGLLRFFKRKEKQSLSEI